MAKHDSIFKTIEEMQAEKADWVERTKRLNNFEGIKNTLTKLYTSSGHFIFELLQNAEDVSATTVTFKLEPDKLIFEHNGTRLFDINDVDSITNIGDSTKEDNGNTIGKFGIGFKSVFEYTASPEIHSGNYHFTIEDLFVPKVIAPSFEIDNGKTVIILPFNTPSKDKKECYEEINNSLNKLQATDLLFLQNITEINCIINSKTITIKRIDSYNDNNCPNNVCKVFKLEKEKNVLQVHDKNAPKIHMFYKRFFKSISVLGEDKNVKKISIGIAFKIEYSKEDKKWRIKPIFKNDSTLPDGQIFAYFPCNAEERKFCFHIHAPFALTVDREKLRDDEANKSVIEEIGTLICDSIKELKDDGLIDLDLYKALPNQIDDDNLGKFEIIDTKLQYCFMNNSYILMADGSYQDCQNKFIGFHNIQQLLSNKDLSMLYNPNQQSYWVKNPMQNRRDYNFLRSLQIKEYSVVEFLRTLAILKDKLEESYTKIINEFSNRGVDWYVRLYSLMGSNIGWNSIVRNQLQYSIKSLQLCYCNDKKLYKFEDCFLSDSVSDIESSAIHCINSECLTSKQTDIDLTFFFKKNLGIKEYKLSDMIETLCKDFEDNENKSISDSIEFYKIYQIDNSVIDILINHKILCSNEDTWDSPDCFYLPEEFGVSASNISIYFDFYNSKINTQETKRNSIYYYWQIPKEKPFYKLSLEYKTQFNSNNEIIDFTDFLKKLGVTTSLPVWKSSCKTNPEWKTQIWANSEHFCGGNAVEINEDFEIKYLENFLKRTPNEGVFELLLDFLKGTSTKWKTCRYSPAQKYPSKTYPSHIIVDLKNASWVLQVSDGKKTFVKPEEASLSRIPLQYRKQIENSNINDWLSYMGFGKKEREQNEKYIKENEILSSIGLDIGFVDIIRELQNNGVSKSDLQNYMVALKDDLNTKIADGYFSRDNIDEDRIKTKSVENFNSADDIEYEERLRSVRIGYKQKELADPFLRDNYIDSEKRMHCQICKGLMPFKNKDNMDYFEIVQLFHADLIKKDVKENYIALCPVCSAKTKVYYQHNKKLKNDLYNRIRESQSNITDFKIMLDKDENITFSKRHIIALKQMIEESVNYEKENYFINTEEASTLESTNSEIEKSFDIAEFLEQSLTKEKNTHKTGSSFNANSIETTNSNVSSTSSLNDSQENEIKKTYNKVSPVESFIASRLPTLSKGHIQFKKEDGSIALVEEKPNLPWTNRNIKVNVYKKENGIIIEWDWDSV